MLLVLILENVYILPQFWILLQIFQELVILILNIRIDGYVLVQMLQLPVTGLLAHGLIVRLLDQKHIGHRFGVQLLIIGIIDVCITQIIPQHVIARLEQIPQMRLNVDGIIVNAQLGRFHDPNVGQRVTVRYRTLARECFPFIVPNDLHIHYDKLDHLLWIADRFEGTLPESHVLYFRHLCRLRIDKMNRVGHLGN
uniref:Uncharacterized protein n=1 Tax=Anopheles christyi TaxID=43041 RepID=A0A182KII8_9DIPT